ncbi:MAG: MmcB family DNA repair protein [Kordiimonadaceae bacterium]|nr:MmcB family DNA repair protein [Kordiimonadaceae bacterium]
MTSTAMITCGAERLLIDLGYAPLREITLTNGRRVDLVGLNSKGDIAVVEVKSGLADFRSDNKWQDYLIYCNSFYFAVDQNFPLGLLNDQASLPEVTGIIIADKYGGDVVRQPCARKVNAARARKMVQKMARTGALRLAEQALR